MENQRNVHKDSGTTDLNMIQIHASSEEVKKWIEAFVSEKRNLTNVQNIKDFCKPPELRQNCARVDTVFIKKRLVQEPGVHTAVEHVRNYWGPQMISRRMHPEEDKETSYHTDGIPSSLARKINELQETFQKSCEKNETKKRIYSAIEIEEKLERLKKKKDLKSDSESS